MKKRISPHEERLAWILEQNGIAFVREYRFDEVGTGELLKNGTPKYHKWRFDFAILDSKIALEVEGGTWSRGRHIHPLGFKSDCVKYNEAAHQGWRVYRLVPELIKAAYILRLLSAAKPFQPE